MLLQILVGSGLLVMTTVMHAGGMGLGLRWLMSMSAKRLAMVTIWTRSLVVGGVVLIMFLFTLLEAGAWVGLIFLLP